MQKFFALLHALWTAIFPPPEVPPLPVITTPPVSPPPEPPPPPVVEPISLPALSTRVGSRWFHASDGTLVDYREATAMGIYRLWLDGDDEKVDALFSYFQSRGITAIRPLLNLDSAYWAQHRRLNSYLEGDHFFGQLVPFLRHAAEYGLYVRLCLFGGVEPFVGHQLDWVDRPDVVTGDWEAKNAMHAYLDQVVCTTRDETNLLYEIANEPAQIGFGSDSAIVKELGRHCNELAPNRLMNFGCATDEDNLFYNSVPAQCFDEHLARHDEWDGHAAIKRLIEHAGLDQQERPFLSGEWMNLGTGGIESTACALASAAMLRLKKGIPAFHARCLLWGDVPDEPTDACLHAWSRALDLIPMETTGQGCNGHWSCSPLSEEIFPPTEEATDDWHGPVRCFGLDGPDGYLGVSLREPAGYALQGHRRPIETLTLERWGDWQSRIFRA